MGANEFCRERTGDSDGRSLRPKLVKDAVEELCRDALTSECWEHGGRQQCDSVDRFAVNDASDDFTSQYGFIDAEATVSVMMKSSAPGAVVAGTTFAPSCSVPVRVSILSAVPAIVAPYRSDCGLHLPICVDPSRRLTNNVYRDRLCRPNVPQLHPSRDVRRCSLVPRTLQEF